MCLCVQTYEHRITNNAFPSRNVYHNFTQLHIDSLCVCAPQKKLAAEPDYTDASLSAAERVRALGKLGTSVEISQEVEPRRYFRSGVEMERMASVYLQEGSLENAYVLYTKFIT